MHQTDRHKIDSQKMNTNWPVFFSKYIEIWENQYDHIPNREPIIVLELPERQGLLNLRRRDGGTGPSTAPIQSPGPMPQPMTPTPQPLQIMPGAYPSPYIYPNPYMFPFPSPMPGWKAWPGASPFLITLTQPTI
ncbi:hypothetical protein Gotur_009966, partial [Gossypium turneri]